MGFEGAVWICHIHLDFPPNNALFHSPIRSCINLNKVARYIVAETFDFDRIFSFKYCQPNGTENRWTARMFLELTITLCKATDVVTSSLSVKLSTPVARQLVLHPRQSLNDVLDIQIYLGDDGGIHAATEVVVPLASARFNRPRRVGFQSIAVLFQQLKIKFQIIFKKIVW